MYGATPVRLRQKGVSIWAKCLRQALKQRVPLLLGLF